MKRNIYNNLLEWKNKNNHKPLLIFGARQVGKTYTITEFCHNEYKNVIIINLLENEQVIKLYNEQISSEEKLISLKAIFAKDMDIESPDTVIFIDEIQESEKLIAELKFFNEKYPKINIICAGSLLGVKLRRTHFSFPVGKVEMLNMYPLNFEEFLLALSEKKLLNEIKVSFKTNKPLSSLLHQVALTYYKYYLCLGGMPELVHNFLINDNDVTKTDFNLLTNIIESYFNDMSKYVTNKNETLKIEKLYNSIPTQLSNESNKFQYSKINKNARGRDYETSLDWLLASRLLIINNKVKTPNIPLKGFLESGFFKLFLSDVGVLRSILELKLSDILTNNLGIYKGPITENYVATELTSNNINLYYYSNRDLTEIDFLLYTKDGIIPVEVKASDKVKSRSLNKYNNKFKPKYSIRLSTKNFGFVNNIKSVPLYATFCIKDI